MQSTNYAKAVTDKVLQKKFLVKNGLNLFQSLRLQKWFEAICHGNLSGSQSGLIQMCNWNNEKGILSKYVDISSQRFN